ncbi:cytochrome b [Acuticoccus mangrovi]|uniref:Cytochrome b n=1 Tax=Acuticoccus mangrovi TaxID=2796142 RepID=A0A934IMW3_9HYPH|nr:cytochrome b N-terminal domain-containing protein [Acuticoccus mangrovi]MBJ3775371.1 cytochrome b N-terminal domain-containing protein [Acuticoccus mangrovi]
MAGHGTSNYQPKNKVVRWVDSRLPIFSLMNEQAIVFPTPKNLNYLWTFGAILSFMLATMMISGIVLAMHYAANTELAFDRVEHIMRDVNFGWLIRYIHAVGASMFFFAVYMHIARGLYYGSYKAPREILWMLGVVILILMMATGFMGYVLPWGQMSFWGATVITNLFSAIPLVGPSIVEWLWGGFAVDNATLNRFFSLHYLLPFVIAGVVVLHIWALHEVGNNNPTGVSVKSSKDTVPFHPYLTMKDFFALVCFMVLYAYFVFYIPNYLGHPDNYIEADPLVTPAHIVPEWYLLPFYAMLRAIPSKLGGVVVMFSSLLILFVVPWLDTSKVRSAKYRPMFKIAFWVFVISCIALGWLGSQPAEGVYVMLARFFTFYYFAFFLILMPLLGIIETPKPVPNSIAESVLARHHGSTATVGSGEGRPDAAPAAPKKD